MNQTAAADAGHTRSESSREPSLLPTLGSAARAVATRIAVPTSAFSKCTDAPKMQERGGQPGCARIRGLPAECASTVFSLGCCCQCGRLSEPLTHHRARPSRAPAALEGTVPSSTLLKPSGQACSSPATAQACQPATGWKRLTYPADEAFPQRRARGLRTPLHHLSLASSNASSSLLCSDAAVVASLRSNVRLCAWSFCLSWFSEWAFSESLQHDDTRTMRQRLPDH